MHCAACSSRIERVLGGIISPRHHPANFALVQFVLVLGIMFLGRRFYIDGFSSLARLAPTMDSLIAVGTGSAFVYSTWKAGQNPIPPMLSRT